MAVVAVLLNNKLYVANVGEPPVQLRVGRAGSGQLWGSGSLLGNLLSGHVGPAAQVCRGHRAGFRYPTGVSVPVGS